MNRKRLVGLCVCCAIGIVLTTYLVIAGDASQHAHRKSSNPAVDSGPLANATVSFGAWITPLNRFQTLPPPTANLHELVPQIAKIKAGGTVNFIISGLHNVAIYEDGTQPSDINTSLLSPPPMGTMLPPVINDPNGRIYFGPDPRPLLPVVDRVEVVHFPDPGTYLVICGVLPHFQDGMFGFVRVLP